MQCTGAAKPGVLKRIITRRGPVITTVIPLRFTRLAFSLYRLDQRSKAMTQSTTGALGYCPKCGSSQLTPLPANQFSRKPGFFCDDCKSKLRTPNSTWVYVGIVALGIALAAGGIAVMFSDAPDNVARGRRSPLFLVIAGGACAIWAGRQLFIPKLANAPKSN